MAAMVAVASLWNSKDARREATQATRYVGDGKWNVAKEGAAEAASRNSLISRRTRSWVRRGVTIAFFSGGVKYGKWWRDSGRSGEGNSRVNRNGGCGGEGWCRLSICIQPLALGPKSTDQESTTIKNKGAALGDNGGLGAVKMAKLPQRTVDDCPSPIQDECSRCSW
ncbi:UNVERIFIED_CONTAM: hypothetical protein Slati_4462400 [Sesamum latifolium]|uniref:Uncharacterized protein n=1 Tax=Sesamum latifolium TaxID=2727402 RepID=A0AAW2SRV0_9LAMI